jgi:hypothetical protein
MDDPRSGTNREGQKENHATNETKATTEKKRGVGKNVEEAKTKPDMVEVTGVEHGEEVCCKE